MALRQESPMRTIEFLWNNFRASLFKVIDYKLRLPDIGVKTAMRDDINNILTHSTFEVTLYRTVPTVHNVQSL